VPVSAVLGAGAFLPNPVAITNLAALLPFEDAGIVDLITSIDSFSRLDSCTPFNSSPICSQTDDVSWSGTLQVTYQFTPSTAPADLPEPASLSLLGTAVAAVVTLRRRRSPRR